MAAVPAPAVSAFSKALKLRGGLTAGALLGTGPDRLFNSLFLGLIVTVFGLKRASSTSEQGSGKVVKAEDPGMKSLQWRFLAVFWLFKMADWLQGPYFYEVYASKVIGGVAASGDLIAKLFLTGFATTALLGPFIGKAVDKNGRKKGSIAFAIFYILGALSTRSNVLSMLLLGRVMSGMGTSLLFSAPESWLAGEHQAGKYDDAALGKTFGLAYFGDSIVAMTAGLLAQASANKVGPTGPFTLSIGFLAAGMLLVSALWKENTRESVASAVGGGPSESGDDKGKGGILPAIQAMRKDPKIALVGAVQSLFEGAMYIFVLQWPPAFISVMGGSQAVPFGRVFSCFMACCMLGSTAFGALMDRGITVENSMCGMLAAAAASLMAAAAFGSSLAVLVAAFFAFEACVGLYFPSIGTLRSKYLPDEHRSVLMNLFGIPLNLIVIVVYTNIKRLGTTGALWCSTGTLAASFFAALRLSSMASASRKAAEEGSVAPA